MHYQTFRHDNHEYRCDIWEAIMARLNALTHRFARTFVMRLDIRFPGEYHSSGTNCEISKFLKRLVEIYTAYPSDPADRIAPYYVVVREQNISHNPHYHLALMFDGSKLRNGWTVQAQATTIWKRILGEADIAADKVDGCINLSDPLFIHRHGIMLQNPLQDATGLALQEQEAEFGRAHAHAIHWLLYLAKTRTKGNDVPWHAKEWFCSRL